MTTPSVFHEDMNAVEIMGQETFVLEWLCTAMGELPDRGAFVLSIVDPADQSKDTFVRVANMADYEDMTSNRATAIINGETQWRYHYVRLEYHDLEEATAVKQAMNDRLHQLVEDYIAFDTTLHDNTDHSFPYPVGFQTNVEQLTDDFYTAYDTYLAAKEALLVADAAVIQAQAAINNVSAAFYRMSYASAASLGLDTRYAEMVSAKSRFDNLVGLPDNPPAAPSNAEWFITQVETALAGHADPVLEGHKDTFKARIADERTTGGAELGNFVTNHLTQKGQAASEKTAADTAYDVLSDAVATAISNQTNATKVKSDAWVALYSDPASAYNQLFAACPTFEASHGYTFPPTP